MKTIISLSVANLTKTTVRAMLKDFEKKGKISNVRPADLTKIKYVAVNPRTGKPWSSYFLYWFTVGRKEFLIGHAGSGVYAYNSKFSTVSNQMTSQIAVKKFLAQITDKS